MCHLFCCSYLIFEQYEALPWGAAIRITSLIPIMLLHRHWSRVQGCSARCLKLHTFEGCLVLTIRPKYTFKDKIIWSSGKATMTSWWLIYTPSKSWYMSSVQSCSWPDSSQCLTKDIRLQTLFIIRGMQQQGLNAWHCFRLKLILAHMSSRLSTDGIKLSCSRQNTALSRYQTRDAFLYHFLKL